MVLNNGDDDEIKMTLLATVHSKKWASHMRFSDALSFTFLPVKIFLSYDDFYKKMFLERT